MVLFLWLMFFSSSYTGTLSNIRRQRWQYSGCWYQDMDMKEIVSTFLPRSDDRSKHVVRAHS